MARRIIQSPVEILMFPGDEITVRFKVVDNTEAETRIDLTGATDIELNIFEFLDDTVTKKLITGSVFVDAPDDQLEFNFAVADTSALVPKTYIYTVKMTLASKTIITHKSLLTIKDPIV